MTSEIGIGSTLAGYRIEAQLGRGGMGVVYRAEQPRLGRHVAIKVIAPDLASDEGFRERFKRESRLAAAIEHSNAIPIYEAGEEGETLFLVMRYIHGTDLRRLISDHGRLEPARIAGIVGQIAGALDEAHARGLVHRDVKPANILIASQRGHDHAFLTDFGLTKQASSHSGLTGTGQWVGTIDYAAPEQVEGKRVDARADVYALGCVLFEGLTGRIPFAKESDMAKLFAHVNEAASPPSTVVEGLPPEVDDTVLRALAKDRNERFPSAGDLGRGIAAATEGRSVAAPERTVAAGAAAPTDSDTAPDAPQPTVAAPGTSEATEAPPAPTVAPAEPTVAPPAPTVAPAEPTVAPAREGARTAAGGGASAAPTDPLPAARPRRRRAPLIAAAGLGVVALAAALVLGLSGGGGDDDSLEFTRVSVGAAYTLEVPVGWEPTAEEEEGAQGQLRTDFVSPSRESRLSVLRFPRQDEPPAEVAREARANVQDDEGFVERSFEEVTINGETAVNFQLDKIDQFGLGDVESSGYFLNRGDSGFRVQNNAQVNSDETAQTDEVARHAAETVEVL